jgi:hypothetical protein
MVAYRAKFWPESESVDNRKISALATRAQVDLFTMDQFGQQHNRLFDRQRGLRESLFERLVGVTDAFLPALSQATYDRHRQNEMAV